jgi:hypothetical protein
MEQHIYCDGIGRIAIIGGVVRLDLFTYSPTETDANGNPRPVLSHRIVMGTEGFARSSEKVVEAVQFLARNRAPQPPAAPPPQAAPPAPIPPPQARPQTPQWPPHAAQPNRVQQPPAAAPAQPANKTSEPPPLARPPFP